MWRHSHCPSPPSFFLFRHFDCKNCNLTNVNTNIKTSPNLPNLFITAYFGSYAHMLIHSLNPTNTEYIIINHPRRRKNWELLPQVFINRENIKQLDKTKYLGIIVDDTLGWEEQYESVKKKVAGGLAAMKKLKGILSQSMLFQVYKALVESHLRYADVVWGSLSETKITALQRLQNRAFEIIQVSKIKDSLIRPTFSID